MNNSELTEWLLKHLDKKTGTLDLRLGYLPSKTQTQALIEDSTDVFANPGHGGGGGHCGGGGGHSGGGFGGGGFFGGGHSSGSIFGSSSHSSGSIFGSSSHSSSSFFGGGRSSEAPHISSAPHLSGPHFGSGIHHAGHHPGFPGFYPHPYLYPANTFYHAFPYFNNYAIPYSYSADTNDHPDIDQPVDPSYGIFVAQFMRDPAPFLQQHHVKTLILGNQKGNWDPKSALPALLGCEELVAMDLTNNGLDDADAALVLNSKTLQKVDLANNDIRSITLSGNTVLQSLNLEFNKLTSASISHNSALQALSMGFNNLVKATLMHNPALEKLNLGDNKISDDIEISHNDALKVVNLENNLLTATGMKGVEKNNGSIVSLNVNHNSLGDAGAIALQGSSVLETLYAHDNEIHQVGAQGIAQISSLKTLDISNNHIEDAGAIPLAQNLNNINLQHTKIGTDTVDALLKNEKLVNVQTCLRDVGPFNKFRLWNFVKDNNDDSSKHALFKSFDPSRSSSQADVEEQKSVKNSM